MQLEIMAWAPAGVRAIPLRKRGGSVRAYAWVDEQDAHLADHKWFYRRGYAVRSTYPYGKGKAVSTYMHREILGLGRGDKASVDHLNHNTLDNRRANIRVCTHAQNHQNRSRHRGSSSKYRGVGWRKDMGKWQAYGCVDGKNHNLGFYEDEDVAGTVAAAWRKLYMPFAVA